MAFEAVLAEQWADVAIEVNLVSPYRVLRRRYKQPGQHANDEDLLEKIESEHTWIALETSWWGGSSAAGNNISVGNNQASEYRWAAIIGWQYLL
jgi:hypothetical protein